MWKIDLNSILKLKILCLIIISFFCTNATDVYGQVDVNLKLQYTFENLTPDSSQVMDDAGVYISTFINNATVKKIGDFSVLDLGSENGYLDLGSDVGNIIASLSDFSISTYLYINESVDLSPNGNFIWAFANSTNMASDQNGNMFLRATTMRYAISKIHWSGESTFQYGSDLTKGTWKHVTYTQSGTTGKIYIDGVSVVTGTITLQPKDIGATPYNFLGRSPYTADVYLKNTQYYDFRIYDKALNATEVATLDDNLDALNGVSITDLLAEAREALTLGNLDEVVSDLTLPTSADHGIEISWESSNESVISNQGVVFRPAVGEDTVEVQLTATLSKSGKDTTKEFTATVLPLFDDKGSVKRDSTLLVLSARIHNLRTDIDLPTQGIEGSTITWVSDKTDYLTNTGELLQLAAKGAGREKVTLTATITKGAESAIKIFTIYIAEDEGFTAYLFAYFIGNSGDQEAIRFALSNDGLKYTALNGNLPVLSSDDISSTGGVRDPHILHRAGDSTYYMVATDMVSANGWNSNHGIVMLKSTDLVTWTSSTVDIKAKFAEFNTIDRAWAPQTIYDSTEAKYMVYFSLHKPGEKDIIYYSYANEDFTDLATTPIQLYTDPNNSSCIDGDIIYKDGKYYLFHKNESGGGIFIAISDHLTGGYELIDEPVDQTTDAVEGSGVFKLINSDTYILMYDLYTTGSYQFTTSTDLLNFSIIEGVSMNFTPRHGTVMPVTQIEVDSLIKKWGTSGNLVVQSSNSASVKIINIVIDNSNNTVYLPVKNGTDLSTFDPELVTTPGVKITPDTPQDFTQGPVEYTLSIDGLGSKTYNVTAHVDFNPLLEGYYADPEVLYSEKTGKYYIYPTSDGFAGWSGTYFKTFSSDNLKDWTDEGVILDLPTDVEWASTNAWAPTILEKKIDDEYKYFYYFCAAQKIGVAVADDPTGPFVDSGQPLISSTPFGASGQQIDPDVFYDPVSDKTYLYWGNGYMARTELNEDMISLNQSTIKVMTPNSTFREGAEVFYRDGKYYFLWSENDTRSPDYRVRYGTSDSPTGSLTIPKNNLVIAKDVALGIYGTGHNCVLYVPDSSKWYIIYHRFTRPKGITMGDAAGYNREVCIDELQFDDDGNILRVRPTLEGFGSEIVATDIRTGDSNLLPQKTALYANYPNPFNPTTKIKYSLSQGHLVELKVYNIIGQQVAVLVKKKQNAGEYIVNFDASNLASGLYFYRLNIGNKFVQIKKMLLIK